MDLRLPAIRLRQTIHKGFVRRKTVGFSALILLCGVVGVAWVAGIRPTVQRESQLSTTAENARTEPLVVAPQFEGILPVSAAEWEWIQQQVQPPGDAKGQVNLSLCLHLLRAHGLAARFPQSDLSSSGAILKLVTDQQAGEEYFGRPCLVKTRGGIRFPTDLGQVQAENHRDFCLATLGEVGLPLSYPLLIDGNRFTLRDVLRDSVANFHLGQEELAWTALAYALYLPPIQSWTNRFGARFSFDDLAEEMMKRPLNKASCCGMHLIHSSTVVARVDAEIPVLSEPVRSRLLAWLRRLAKACAATQHPEGCWPYDWHAEAVHHAGAGTKLTPRDTPQSRLLATGHVAEWLLILPDGVQVSRNVQRKAAQWLYDRLRESTAQEQLESFCPYSHAVHVVRKQARVSITAVATSEGTLSRESTGEGAR